MRAAFLIATAAVSVVTVTAHTNGLHHDAGAHLDARRISAPHGGMTRRVKRQNIIDDALGAASSAIEGILNPSTSAAAAVPSAATSAAEPVSSAAADSVEQAASSAPPVASRSSAAPSAMATTTAAPVVTSSAAAVTPSASRLLTTSATESSIRAVASSTVSESSTSASSESASGTASAASASAFTDEDKKESSGLPKTTLIIIIVVASCVALVAAVWTIIRKTAFSPSRKFEAKLAPIEWDEPSKVGGAAARRDSYGSAGGPMLARNGSMGSDRFASDKGSLRHAGSIRGGMSDMGGYPASIPYHSAPGPAPYGGPAYAPQTYHGGSQYSNSLPGYPAEPAYGGYGDVQRGSPPNLSRLPSSNYGYNPRGHY